MARLTAASAAAWLALGAAPIPALAARGGLRASYVYGSEPSIRARGLRLWLLWEQARASRRCMHLSRKLDPLAPDTSVDYVPRRCEASCRRWKDVLRGLVALSSSWSLANSPGLWQWNEGAR